MRGTEKITKLSHVMAGEESKQTRTQDYSTCKDNARSGSKGGMRRWWFTMAVVFVEVIDVYDASKDENLKNYIARKIEEQVRKGKER